MSKHKGSPQKPPMPPTDLPPRPPMDTPRPMPPRPPSSSSRNESNGHVANIALILIAVGVFLALAQSLAH